MSHDRSANGAPWEHAQFIDKNECLTHSIMLLIIVLTWVDVSWLVFIQPACGRNRSEANLASAAISPFDSISSTSVSDRTLAHTRTHACNTHTHTHTHRRAHVSCDACENEGDCHSGHSDSHSVDSAAGTVSQSDDSDPMQPVIQIVASRSHSPCCALLHGFGLLWAFLSSPSTSPSGCDCHSCIAVDSAVALLAPHSPPGLPDHRTGPGRLDLTLHSTSLHFTSLHSTALRSTCRVQRTP